MNPSGIHDDHCGLTTESYQDLIKDALDGVPTFYVEEVRERLKVLDPADAKMDDSYLNWPEAMSVAPSRSDFKSRMIESVIETACEADGKPYIAQAIVSRFFNWQGYLREENFAVLSKGFLSLVDALLAGCPGSEGIDQKTVTLLKVVKILSELRAPIASGTEPLQ